MSITKFLIERTGQHFYYDNQTNGMFDADMKPLSIPTTELPGAPSFHKSNAPDTIKIVLGHACNYSCSYCVQKDIGNPDERSKNIFTRTLIKNIKEQLDLSQLKRIELWGGETLLYWKDIVDIMTHLDNENITWYIPTNGTPLQHKHPEFFSNLKGKVTVGISHDGPGHEKLRGPEFLHKKVDVLADMQERGIAFSFNGVISATNYDLYAFNDYFQEFLSTNGLQETGLVYEVGRSYDSTQSKNSNDHVITGEHLQIYSGILKRYLKQHLEDFKTKKSTLLKNSLFHFGSGVIPYARTLKHQHARIYHSNCGTDQPGLITFDINGSVRTCQNAGQEFSSGHITNLSEARLVNVEYGKKGFCKDCHVLSLCNSSCPIELPFDVFLMNHAIEYTHYSAIQMSAFELLFNSEISKV